MSQALATAASSLYFGVDRRWGFTGTGFGPGFGDFLGGVDGVERRCGLTGTVFLPAIVFFSSRGGVEPTMTIRTRTSHTCVKCKKGYYVI